MRVSNPPFQAKITQPKFNGLGDLAQICAINKGGEIDKPRALKQQAEQFARMNPHYSAYPVQTDFFKLQPQAPIYNQGNRVKFSGKADSTKKSSERVNTNKFMNYLKAGWNEVRGEKTVLLGATACYAVLCLLNPFMFIGVPIVLASGTSMAFLIGIARHAIQQSRKPKHTGSR